MKKRIAVIIAILMLAETMTVCTNREVMLSSPIFTETNTRSTTAPTTEEPTAEEQTKMVTETTKTTKLKSKKKATVKVSAEPKETMPAVTENSIAPKVTQPATEKPTQKVTQKATTKKAPNQKTASSPKAVPKKTAKPKTTPKPKSEPKPTKPAVKKKTVDISAAVSAGISYGKPRGMVYDTSLNVGNSSWFPSTDSSIYDSTNELTSALKGDIAYLIDSFGNEYEPSDISFNVIAKGKHIYVVYG